MVEAELDVLYVVAMIQKLKAAVITLIEDDRELTEKTK